MIVEENAPKITFLGATQLEFGAARLQFRVAVDGELASDGVLWSGRLYSPSAKPVATQENVHIEPFQRAASQSNSSWEGSASFRG